MSHDIYPLMVQLPKPAEILHLDFRSGPTRNWDPSKPIRLLEWNIERGYKLDAIIEELRTIDADILALQARRKNETA